MAGQARDWFGESDEGEEIDPLATSDEDYDFYSPSDTDSYDSDDSEASFVYNETRQRIAHSPEVLL